MAARCVLLAHLIVSDVGVGNTRSVAVNFPAVVPAPATVAGVRRISTGPRIVPGCTVTPNNLYQIQNTLTHFNVYRILYWKELNCHRHHCHHHHRRLRVTNNGQTLH